MQGFSSNNKNLLLMTWLMLAHHIVLFGASVL